MMMMMMMILVKNSKMAQDRAILTIVDWYIRVRKFRWSRFSRSWWWSTLLNAAVDRPSSLTCCVSAIVTTSERKPISLRATLIRCNRPLIATLLGAWSWSRDPFLSRVSILTRDIDIAYLSLCPSVCPSVRYVPVPDENGLTYRHSFFSPYGSRIILVLPALNIFTEFRRGHAKYKWGITISRFSTSKSLYLANDTRYRHSYYGRRIGTRMRAIKWCHFQRPWTNPNPVVKVTPVFDAKYLINGYRYGHSYYRRRIGNCTQAFERHQFRWHWVKVTILFNVKKNWKMVQDRAIFTMADQ